MSYLATIKRTNEEMFNSIAKQSTHQDRKSSPTRAKSIKFLSMMKKQAIAENNNKLARLLSKGIKDHRLKLVRR